MNPVLVKDNIIIPALVAIESYSEDAVDLVWKTGAAESSYKNIRQIGGGPARSWFQMERATHDDIWSNFLGSSRRMYLVDGLRDLSRWPGDFGEMENNPFYAAAMCRIHYLRVPERLPDKNSLVAQAHYWKEHYNTHLGKGTIGGFMEDVTAVL